MPYGNFGGASGARCVNAGPPRRRRRRAGAVAVAIVGLGALGLTPARGAAQGTGGPPAGGAAPSDPFVGVVLSDSQQVALRALTARTSAAAAPFRDRLLRATPADTVLARAMRDSLVALYTAHNAALRQELTADQRATFDANMAAFAAAHRAAAQARDRERMRHAPAPSTSATATGGRP